jgi:hypothetical protein
MTFPNKSAMFEAGIRGPVPASVSVPDAHLQRVIEASPVTCRPYT